MAGWLSITVNVPKAKIRGFELDGNIRPADWLVIGGNVNYTHARFTDNVVSVIGIDGTSTGTAVYDTYPDTPKWSGVFYSDITIPVSERFNAVLHGDVYAQTSNYYSSTGKSLNPNTQIPGYALANFRVGLEQKEDGLSLSVLVKNAFKRPTTAAASASRACSASTSWFPVSPAPSCSKPAIVSEFRRKQSHDYCRRFQVPPRDPADPHWTETIFVIFSVPEAGVSGNLYVLARPNLGICHSSIEIHKGMCFHPWQIHHNDSQMHLPCPEDFSDFTLENGLSFKAFDERDSRFTYKSLDGACEVDLSFRAICDPFDPHDPAQVPALGGGQVDGYDGWNNGHMESKGRIEGSLLLRGAMPSAASTAWTRAGARAATGATRRPAGSMSTSTARRARSSSSGSGSRTRNCATGRSSTASWRSTANGARSCPRA
ncbi:TonB-dependent receptor domain-containing protein [Novosphingobium resinovorum]